MSKAVIVRAAVLAASLVIAGCGLFGGDKRREAYQGSREGRTLEVPPDLDTPETTRSLVIPETGAVEADSDTAPPSDAPSAAPSARIEPGDEATLKLGDGVAGAWRRVGLALERSGVGEIVSRDESAYTFTVKSTVTERDRGLLSRMFGRDKVKIEEATRVVRIVQDGDGSLIRIEDESGATVEDTAARRLIAAIKQRLG